MSWRQPGSSIALAMKLTAIVALDLALIRLVPAILESPPFLYGLVALDLVIVQVFALGRPLRVPQYTFLIVGAISAVAMTWYAFRESRPEVGSLHVLETLILSYRARVGGGRVVMLPQEFPNLVVAERWTTSLLTLLPAWVSAVAVSRMIRRRGS